MIRKLLRKLRTGDKNILSFKQGFDLTELPIVTLYQKDKKFNFILDTGANDSIIDAKALKDLEHTPIDRHSSLFGMEGRLSRRQNCNITLSYNNVEYQYDYIICDMQESFGRLKKEHGVTLHGIIGSKFFTKFKYVLDFDELIAYSKI